MLLMKIIKTRIFAKWAKKNDVNEQSLVNAAYEISADNFEANLGGGIIKKRIANKGRGKSSSARTIVAFKRGSHLFYVFGFEKNEKSNISKREEDALKIVARELFAFYRG